MIVWYALGEQTAQRESRPQPPRTVAQKTMTEQLGRRCALVMLASMTFAVAMGLIAWGPILLTAQVHEYAGDRMWLGMPEAANVWVNLVMFVVGAWGWRATLASHWPAQLRMPWQLFQICAMVSAVVAALYHARPGDTLFVLAHVSTASGFVMLTLGLLAERVHPQFCSRLSCGLVLLAIALTGVAMLISHSLGVALDMRPLFLLEIIPLLVIPAGALSLPGRVTQAVDWIVVLTLYALAKLLEASDAFVLEASGWVSGHTLMHLSLAAAVGWMAYCAAVAGAAAKSAAIGSGETSQRETSLNTAA